MGIIVKAQKRKMQVGTNVGNYMFVMNAIIYDAISQSKVLAQAAKNSGLPQGVLSASWEAIGEVIKDWATEGHSCPIPGLGTMRFGLNAKSVASVDEVSSELITSRKVIFTPSTEIKQALKDTEVSIVCYDENGVKIKDVTSKDDGSVDDDNSGSGSSDSGSSLGDSGSSDSDSGSSDSGNGDDGNGTI